LLEPVYSFDRVVAPAGSKVLGRIALVKKGSRKRRSRAIIQGDFSPILTRPGEIQHAAAGGRLPIETSVSLGAAEVVHLETAGSEHGKEPGAASKAIASARQQIPAEEQLVKSAITLGSVEVPAAELKSVGQVPPAGSLLQTALLTATSHRGTPVKAIVTRPLFSEDDQLLALQGSIMEGMVVQAQPARRLRLHRNGVLRFTFNKIPTLHRPAGGGQPGRRRRRQAGEAEA
jgi:hypothetical protein